VGWGERNTYTYRERELFMSSAIVLGAFELGDGGGLGPNSALPCASDPEGSTSFKSTSMRTGDNGPWEAIFLCFFPDKSSLAFVNISLKH